jgi:hypothetical protein
MADIGFEHTSPVSAADWARPRCAEFGLALTVVRNPKRTCLEMVERRGHFRKQCWPLLAVKSEFLGANREINVGHHRTLPDALLSCRPVQSNLAIDFEAVSIAKSSCPRRSGD